jgi:hypothetical protein
MSELSTKPALIAHNYIKYFSFIIYIGRQLASTSSLPSCHLMSAYAIQLLKFLKEYF